ncbi:MAG TPA: hypothetical protein PK876_06985 [Elusimicrobiota bacterium]|nr:hypothetical protein [Elusimicrobiota bacterium]
MNYLKTLAVVVSFCLLGRPTQAEPAMKEFSTAHFVAQHESYYPPAGIANVLEELHGKLLMDLAPFAPWAQSGTIRVSLYKSPDSYRQATGAAPWVGGHIDVSQRKIFTFESPDFQRTMSHELAHLLFEDYFLSQNQQAPLWLNEGVASLMESDYGGSDDLDDEDALLRYHPIPMDEFFRFNYHTSAPTGPEVLKWYAQARSVTAFLMRRFSQGQFVTFCDSLRGGADTGTALKRAYYLQIPDSATLERLWRDSLIR